MMAGQLFRNAEMKILNYEMRDLYHKKSGPWAGRGPLVSIAIYHNPG